MGITGEGSIIRLAKDGMRPSQLHGAIWGECAECRHIRVEKVVPARKCEQSVIS